ncbi:MAG: GrpB family protein [Candidatus Thermoplasmatota archaeon]|nr:GrpB family protein [Candidatus Thermoplasmatota archaeon]
MDKALKQKIQQLAKEEIAIVSYNPSWPRLFEKEKTFLQEILPSKLIGKIEHFGSTAVPGLSAKPIIDMLIEVNSLEETKKNIVPILEAEGYEYLWRPTIGTDPPYYAWFIKRNSDGLRSHHIHMVESDSELWNRLLFRDYLRDFPAEAKRYDTLKKSLAKRYAHDRIGYTKQKSTYIKNIMKKAITYYLQKPNRSKE